MSVTVYTGGYPAQLETINVSGVPSGVTVKAWKQGNAQTLTDSGGVYSITVNAYGTYTITRSDSTAYIDVWVHGDGTYNVSF